jgi:hypothetical protein
MRGNDKCAQNFCRVTKIVKTTWKEGVEVGKYYTGSYTSRAKMKRCGPNWYNNGRFEDGIEPLINCLEQQNNSQLLKEDLAPVCQS